MSILYLVRHGEARTDGPDADRVLTDRGVAGVERVAEWAARAKISVSEIRHSGKRRAEQTAAIFANRLNPARGMTAISGVAPNDDAMSFARTISLENEPVMIVSHLPFLGNAVAALVGSERLIIAFHPSTLVALAAGDDGFIIEFAVHPAIV